MKLSALAPLAVFAAIMIFHSELAALIRRLHDSMRVIRKFRADTPLLELGLILLLGYLWFFVFLAVLFLGGPKPEWWRFVYWPTEYPVRVMAAVTAPLTVLVIVAWLKVPTEVERSGEQAGASDSAYMTLTWLAAGLAFLLCWLLPKPGGKE